jgi:hypothetical protein
MVLPIERPPFCVRPARTVGNQQVKLPIGPSDHKHGANRLGRGLTGDRSRSKTCRIRPFSSVPPPSDKRGAFLCATTSKRCPFLASQDQTSQTNIFKTTS